MKSWSVLALVLIITLVTKLVGVALSYGECAQLAHGAPCKDGLCCSNSGYCGKTWEWCSPENCQSQCWPANPPPPPPAAIPPPPPPPTPTPPAPPSPLSDLIDVFLFDELLKHRNDTSYGCKQAGFYTYSAFINAASSFPEFATVGDTDTRKRELAAFFAQTSHETTGGWDTAPDGRYTWGYCFVEEDTPELYCVNTTEWPCVPGKKYCGRGPIQLSYNYNYGPAGRDIGYDLLTDPDALANNAILSFKSALWFWMTPQAPKPSCHDAITGQWTPTDRDVAANRLPGYGVITNIINGGLECNKGPHVNTYQEDRIGFYEKYCDDFGVSYGDNVDCYYQLPFNQGLGSLLLQDM